MTFNKGDRVKHPTISDWGLGAVLEDCHDDHIRVFFVGAGEKKLSLTYAPLIKVEGPEGAHPVLDNLSTAKPTRKVKYRTLRECIDSFLTLFPEGFHGEDYLSCERNYKFEAHELAKELLSQDALEAHLAEEDYESVVKSVLQVAKKTNLIFPNELISLQEGLSKPEGARSFAETLRALLYGEESIEVRFKAFAGTLMEIDAAKWTTATYFLFMSFPEDHIFIKPTVTQYAADACAFEINYKPTVNWLTYQSVIRFAQYLSSEISELKPRDMIDVQSFMWCISPKNFQAVKSALRKLNKAKKS